MSADTTLEADLAVDAPPVVQPLPLSTRLPVLAFAGALLLLCEFTSPYFGMLGLPISFFLKNKLHLSASGLAQFNLMTAAPLFGGFLFGLVRDRWSPAGRGDRGHLVLFGLILAGLYAVLAVAPPSYLTLLIGVLLATATIQMVWSAARGLASTIGQQHAMAGQISTVLSMATSVASMGAYFLGGVLSAYLESRNAALAARLLFLGGVGLALMIAAFGALGPKSLFTAARREALPASLVADFARLVRHWPIYPVLLIQMLWQFGPAAGLAMQYHLANTLHATDVQVGAWFALFFGMFTPVYVIYGFLCQKVNLRRLLWLGTGFAVLQMVPLLFVHTVNQALVAAVVLGLLGGLPQAAYTDLAVRSCPKGLQGTMMMLLIAMYWIPYRCGDIWGAYLYHRQGGFHAAIIATIVVYALIIPMLLLVPKRLTATVDGQV